MKTVNKMLFSLIILALFLLFSCQTYTFEDAKERIEPIPSTLIPLKVFEQEKAVSQKQNTEKVSPIVVKSEEEKSPLSVAFIPLPSFVMEEDLIEISHRVNQEHPDIIAFSGEQNTLENLVEYLDYEYIEIDKNTLVATNLQYEEEKSPYKVFIYDDQTSIAVSIFDIRNNSYYYEALNGQTINSWETKEDMIDQVEKYLNVAEDMPTLVFASLYQEIDSSILIDKNVLDVVESTHHINQIENLSSLRITGLNNPIHLRSDYLFSRNVIPLQTSMIDIKIAQTRKVPSEERSAISGTFIIK